MKKLISIGTVTLVLIASVFVVSRPTHADTTGVPIQSESGSTEVGNFKVWTTPAYGMFKLRRFGDYCMPADRLTTVPIGAIVLGMETKTCEGIPQRFRRVTYNHYSGWMWDFMLMEIDPTEGHFPPTPADTPVEMSFKDEEVELEQMIEDEDGNGTLPSTLPVIADGNS